MRKVIIIHGMPEKSEYLNPDGSVNLESQKHWLPWLKVKLLNNDIGAETLEMPKPYAPNYKAWKKEFEKEVLDEETSLVGHSLGAAFLLRYLSETNIEVDRVALVAPWLLDIKNKIDFLNFELDKNLLNKVNDLRIFYSADDDKEILESVKKIEKTIPKIKSKVIKLADRGHFTFKDMGTYEFRELLNFLLE